MSDTELIKDKLDIVDFINEYVQLKPSGVNHKGLCPFHGEKTPSFMVSRERGSWHCFGCAKGGDIFSFVQEMEGMEFREALTFLAGRAGVQLTHQVSAGESTQKSRLKDIMTAAARFFHKFLTEIPTAEPARIYLKNRGLTQTTIENWQVGYVPEQWDLLTQYLLKKGHSIDDLVIAGLTIKRDGADRVSGRGYYDRFRGRIMFPIWDVHDGVVGFTGRVLVETEKSGGKYVNTPQSLLYDKSRVVFGLNKAKQLIRTNNCVVLVEGQMDVIACHQAGMNNVVATSGTAMTDEQVKLLKRYSNNLKIAFDADSAGQTAAKRGVDIARTEGMNVKVIRLPDGAGKDADECLKNNPDVWFKAVQDAEDIMVWYFHKAFAGKDIRQPRVQQEVADILLQEISRIPYGVERDYWLRELSGQLGVDASVLRDDIKRFREQTKSGKSNTEKSSSSAPLASSREVILSPHVRRLLILIERLLILILRFPKLAYFLEAVPELHLSTSPYLALYVSLKTQYTTVHSIDISTLRGTIPLEHGEQPVDILLLKGDLLFSTFTESEAKDECSHVLLAIKEEWVRYKRQELQRSLEVAERAGNNDDIARLMGEAKALGQ